MSTTLMAEEKQPMKTTEEQVTTGRRGFRNRYSTIVYRYVPSRRNARRIWSGLAILLLLAGLIALILYLVYRPSHPRFSVASVSVYELRNASPPPSDAGPANAVATRMQFTIVIRNPSDRSAITYDRLTAYVTYRGQPVTPPVALPPLYQEKDSTVAVSPVIGGAFVPVSPDVTSGLVNDQRYGVVGMRLVVVGRVKYRSGAFRSGWDSLYARCDIVMGLRDGLVGRVPLLGEPQCEVDA